MAMRNPQVFFFETFQEEEQALKRHLPKPIRAAFSRKTIQATGLKYPPAPLISIRTQSHVPSSWLSQTKGLLSRSSGYDHLLMARKKIPCGYLPNYCARAVAEVFLHELF